MCCVWVSGLNQIDIDTSATKLLLFTSFSHSPTQLCQDYGCCHHSPPQPATTSVVSQVHYKWKGVKHKCVLQKLSNLNAYFEELAM